MNNVKTSSSQNEREGSVWEILVFAIAFVLLFTLAARSGLFPGFPARTGTPYSAVQAEISASVDP